MAREREQKGRAPVVAVETREFDTRLTVQIGAHALSAERFVAQVDPRRVTGKIGVQFLGIARVEAKTPQLMVQPGGKQRRECRLRIDSERGVQRTILYRDNGVQEARFGQCLEIGVHEAFSGIFRRCCPLGLIAIRTERDEIANIDRKCAIAGLGQMMIERAGRRNTADRALLDTLHQPGADRREPTPGLHQLIAILDCQSAFNRDPLSARKRDPVSVA